MISENMVEKGTTHGSQHQDPDKRFIIYILDSHLVWSNQLILKGYKIHIVCGGKVILAFEYVFIDFAEPNLMIILICISEIKDSNI
jgi:hypothetical protein